MLCNLNFNLFFMRWCHKTAYIVVSADAGKFAVTFLKIGWLHIMAAIAVNMVHRWKAQRKLLCVLYALTILIGQP